MYQCRERFHDLSCRGNHRRGMVIPAELRRDRGTNDGDPLVFERDDHGGMSVTTGEQVVREQRGFRAIRERDRPVDQFLADPGTKRRTERGDD